MRDNQSRIFVFGAQPNLELLSRLPTDGIMEHKATSKAALLARNIQKLRPGKVDLTRSCENVVDRKGRAALSTADLQGFVSFRFRSAVHLMRYLTLDWKLGSLCVYRRPLSRTPYREFFFSDIFDVELDDSNEGNPKIRIHHSSGVLHMKGSKRPNEPDLRQLFNALKQALDSDRSDPKPEDELPLEEKSGYSCYCSLDVVKRMTGVEERNLRAYATKLASELHMQDPWMDFLVVYRHVAKEEQVRNAGIGFNARCIGKVEIHAGLVRDEGAIFSFEPQADDNGVGCDFARMYRHVMDKSNIYAVIKSITIQQKMRMLREMPQASKRINQHCLLSLLVDAITSDCADENARYRHGITNQVKSCGLL